MERSPSCDELAERSRWPNPRVKPQRVDQFEAGCRRSDESACARRSILRDRDDKFIGR